MQKMLLYLYYDGTRGAAEGRVYDPVHERIHIFILMCLGRRRGHPLFSILCPKVPPKYTVYFLDEIIQDVRFGKPVIPPQFIQDLVSEYRQ